ncbi:trifunctional purine biosynthetic protein adenosine-3 [Hyalella azteca]|uniref:Trifunctional purine biosynthetic protein adenosine-3 n=1 Tax=Hyalella azteca TaxID=294128 RepID=A0A8B7PB77_HYAAZ|nr:trifunctional purine biosynthetic protein adenosine-3 [Hyalella azteca]
MASILVLGGGGREHAIVHALTKCRESRSDDKEPESISDICRKTGETEDEVVDKIYVTPGNPGIAKEKGVECLNLDVKQHQSVVEFCRDRSVDLVVVGPEAPLADGITDTLTHAGILVFGPSKAAAMLEADKAFSKAFMLRHGIPTAESAVFTDPDSAKSFIQQSTWKGWVIKACGLAAGKGVIVTSDKVEAVAAVDELRSVHGKAASSLLVEQRLYGSEISALCFTDGRSIAMMPPSQDHKTRYSGNTGPNTGGMGAVCPYPVDAATSALCKDILQAAVDGMALDGVPFKGVLYAGLMLCVDKLAVLEFNCRFGDPETEAILPLLDTNIYLTMKACARGRLCEAPLVRFLQDQVSCAVVVVTQDYPASATKGLLISGLEAASENHNSELRVKVYHNSTAISPVAGSDSNCLVTAGGRVVTVVVTASSTSVARQEACRRAALVKFEGAEWRDDIGCMAEEQLSLRKSSQCVKTSGSPSSGMTYSSSGVDVAAGDAFVAAIKESVAATQGPAVLGGLGDFGGFYDLSVEDFKRPVLVTGTDGVGTKLMIANAMDVHTTIGQDLVAMCVNDIQCHGAAPLVFLDYLATGKLQPRVLQEVVHGIAGACKDVGAALVGGETAEMPGMYRSGEYDVAGFAVGVVEKEELLPKRLLMAENDCLIAVKSSGFHSNGFSLVRKIVESLGLKYTDPCPFQSQASTLGQALLEPTRLYSKVFSKVRGQILGAAHITGGGILGNAGRMLPPHLAAKLDLAKCTIPPHFLWIASQGVSAEEMAATFNLGIGLLLTVKKELKEKVLKALSDEGAAEVGRLFVRPPGGPSVVIDNLTEHLSASLSSFVSQNPTVIPPRRIRTAILISGRGSNMMAIASACSARGSPAEVCLVVSNRPAAAGLVWAEQQQIPTLVIDHTHHSTRESFEEALHSELMKHRIEFVCLAGFMRILTEGFVKLWRGRLINIHPSLLPAFKGKDAQKQALHAGVKLTGCTVHYVEAEVDSGAIIAQASVPVLEGDTEQTLSDRIVLAEHEIFPRSVLEVAARLQQQQQVV